MYPSIYVWQQLGHEVQRTIKESYVPWVGVSLKKKTPTLGQNPDSGGLWVPLHTPAINKTKSHWNWFNPCKLSFWFEAGATCNLAVNTVKSREHILPVATDGDSNSATASCDPSPDVRNGLGNLCCQQTQHLWCHNGSHGNSLYNKEI